MSCPIFRSRSGRAARLTSACVLALTSAACGAGTSSSRSPQAAIQNYAAALQAGDARAAYASLSVEARQRVPFARFEAMLRENPEQVAALAKRLAAEPEQMQVTATFGGNGADRLELVLEDGEWKANLSAIDLYSQASPIAAVAAFVRAFRLGRYDVLLRFVPDSEKAGLTAEQLRAAWEGPQKQEMTDTIQALEAVLPTARAEQYGDKATLPYGSGGTVELTLESGLWKIVNF